MSHINGQHDVFSTDLHVPVTHVNLQFDVSFISYEPAIRPLQRFPVLLALHFPAVRTLYDVRFGHGNVTVVHAKLALAVRVVDQYLAHENRFCDAGLDGKHLFGVRLPNAQRVAAVHHRTCKSHIPTSKRSVAEVRQSEAAQFDQDSI